MNKYRSAMDKITVTPQMEERILTNLSREKGTGHTIKKQFSIKWLRYAGTLAACAAILCVLLLNPSIINLNGGNKQIQAPGSSENSGINANPSGGLQAQMPRSSNGSKKNANPSEGLQAQTPQSSDDSKNNANPSEGLQAQTPRSSNGSKKNANPSEGLQAQVPGSSYNSGESGTQTGNNPIVNTKGIDALKKAVSFELLVPGNLPSGYEIDDTSVIAGELAQIIYSDGNHKITYRTAKGAEDISGDYTSYKESNVVKIDDTEVNFKGSQSLIHLATWMKDDCSYSLSFSTGITKDGVISIIESMKKA